MKTGMMVDIEKIIVRDRIRKDFGNIQELANDIQENGLINPPVVNKEYELLAGERRLRACKSLGWKQIEVRMMDTRDAEHELNVEISENENRKEFSKSERVDYMKRLFRIEQAKSREISDQNLKQNKATDVQKSAPRGKTRDVVSSQFGISHDTMEKEMSIVDNKDLLDPSDFADWDEGKLSTNKAFQKIKAEQDKMKAEMRDLKEERDYFQFQLEEEQKKEPEVKEVIKEVVPDDYEELKQKAKLSDDYRQESKDMRKQYKEMAEKWKKAESEKESLLAEKNLPEAQKAKEVKESALFFCAGISNFIQRYGGYVWLTKELNNMEASEREGFISGINAIEAWVFQMKENMKGDTE